MKAILMFILLCAGHSFSQVEIQQFDSTEFKLFYHKKHPPKVFYNIQVIESPKQLANKAEKFYPSCVNPVRGQLNWAAKHGNNWMICVTRGGAAVMTIVYLLDYDTGKWRAHETIRPVRRGITFGEFLGFLRAGEIKLEELNTADLN